MTDGGKWILNGNDWLLLLEWTPAHDSTMKNAAPPSSVSSQSTGQSVTDAPTDFKLVQSSTHRKQDCKLQAPTFTVSYQ